jgi:hypothetical protein
LPISPILHQWSGHAGAVSARLQHMWCAPTVLDAPEEGFPRCGLLQELSVVHVHREATHRVLCDAPCISWCFGIEPALLTFPECGCGAASDRFVMCCRVQPQSSMQCCRRKYLRYCRLTEIGFRTLSTCLVVFEVDMCAYARDPRACR